MKTNLLKYALSICGILAATLTAPSTPMHRADVAADPNSVLHIDFDSMRPTTIGKHILAEMDKPETQGIMSAFQTALNLDPRKQLHGVTLYNTGKAPEDGVVLAYADFEPERLIKTATAAKEYQRLTYGQYTIHSWIDEQKLGKPGDSRRVYAAFQGEQLVVLAQQEARINRALDVLDRKAPNLTSTSLFSQVGASASTGFIQGAARKMDIPDFAPNAALLRMAKSARVEIGERQGQLRATVGLEASDEDSSRQMALVVEGVVAMLKMQQDNPAVVKLADGVSVRQDGNSVVATLAAPAAQAIELMKADAIRQMFRKASGG